ncbi:MAG: dihydroorotate dehydrogenase (quinone) [Acidobacteria bacterium]|nr:dihydroorotate dehydrogenase (quinone) [Acidobacteriota bacterium]
MTINHHNNRAGDGGTVRLSWAHRLLLSFPPETAHSLAMIALRLAQTPATRGLLETRYRTDTGEQLLQRELLGQNFCNPIGLAAGFDKDGIVIPGMAALGFGWLEVGAVTPRPQRGNPRPRLFRHTAAASLENAMGFNNRGCHALRKRLERFYPAAVPLFLNLGKNHDTPNAEALEDYLLSIEVLDDHCDGFVLNVSSPNTPRLRDLQRVRAIRELVRGARAATDRPVLVKLSPDLDASEAREVANESVASGADGIVLANTSTDYRLFPGARKIGGLSGRVLRQRSMDLLEALAGDLFGHCLLVSVGGISSGEDVYARLRAGANLVQLYSALVFEGPGLVARIQEDLAGLLSRDGFESIDEVIGADLKTTNGRRRAT